MFYSMKRNKLLTKYEFCIDVAFDDIRKEISIFYNNKRCSIDNIHYIFDAFRISSSGSHAAYMKLFNISENRFKLSYQFKHIRFYNDE